MDSTRKLPPPSRTKTFVLILFVLSLAVFVGVRFSESLQGTDFPDFYCAARMLAEGHGHQLYDPVVQREYQARYSGRVGTLYIHPPFEAPVYLAVSWLPLRCAYLLWFVLNLAFLAAGLRCLANDALLPWDWRLLLAAALTFVPVLLCLQQGQDSLLLLLLVVLAFTALRRERAFAAGCWLALALFKFQIVLPLALVLLLTQGKKTRSGLAAGFSLVALTLAALSAAISGWSVFNAYPGFLLQLRSQPFSGIIPQAMANFRGLTYLFFRNDRSSWAIAAVSVLCVAALLIALTVWKAAQHRVTTDVAHDAVDLPFATTVLFATLVSYHLNPHDLSLLLLPIALILHRALARPPQLSRPARRLTICLLGILFLPLLHLWALKAGVYALISVPLLAVFLLSASIARQSQTR